MKVLKVLSLLSLSVLLASCKDPQVTGRLVLTENVKMLKETDKAATPVEIAAGDYKATAKLRDKNTTLYLAIADGKSNPTVKFELPQRFPNQNGEFRVTPKEGGQPYGLHGIVKSQSQNSNSVDEWESCWVNCGPNYPGGGWCGPGGGSGQMGYQRVRFHIRTTHTQYDVDLESAEQKAVGSFDAASEYSEKIYEYRGYCY